MTPDWLYKHSTITKPFTVQPKYLEILPGEHDYKRLIQAELIAPNILTATDSVVVTLTIAMDTVLADSSDHDLSFGISDRTSFVGFEAVDKDNYVNHAPCYNIEGDTAGETLNNRMRDQASGAKVRSRHYSSEIRIQIKPNDRWRSCHTEHDEGVVNIVNYQCKLDMTKGLYLQMYRNHGDEKYRYKYIVVNIYLE